MKHLGGGLLILVMGCASAPSGDRSSVRFAARPIVRAVVPALDVSKRPSEHAPGPNIYFFEASRRRALDALRPEAPRPARDINALGEVPRSSWYAGRPVPAPEAMAAGAGGIAPTPPFEIVGSKSAGVAVGFIVEDATGRNYLLKLEGADFPEIETAAHAIVHRLVWAAGYHVTKDHLFAFDAEQLHIGEGATVSRGLLDRRLTPAKLDEMLRTAARNDDGRLRGFASEFVEGVPLGGFPQVGTRPGDPNDLIPHEDRRALRGLLPWAAWVGHTDMKDGNTLDAWIERDGGHFVRHHLIDFGKALGGFSRIDHVPKLGYGYLIDPRTISSSLFSLGAHVHPWENRQIPKLRGLGWFAAEPFEPSEWRPFAPYLPFAKADPDDILWGALRMARVSRAHVEVAVRAGRLSDPRAEKYLLETLLVRREKVLEWAFARRAPLDAFALGPSARDPAALGGRRLCWSDWAADPLPEAELDGRPVAVAAVGPRTEGGRACAELPPGDGYRVLRLRSTRGRITEVHLTPVDGALAVVGLVRGEYGAMTSAHP